MYGIKIVNFTVDHNQKAIFDILYYVYDMHMWMPYLYTALKRVISSITGSSG